MQPPGFLRDHWVSCRTQDLESVGVLGPRVTSFGEGRPAKPGVGVETGARGPIVRGMTEESASVTGPHRMS